MVNLKDIYIYFYPKGIVYDSNDVIDLSSFIDNVEHWFRNRFYHDIRSVFNNFDTFEFGRDEFDNYKFELIFYRVDFDTRIITEQFIKENIIDIDKDGDFPMNFGYDRIEYNNESYDHIYLLGNPDTAIIRFVDATPEIREEDL